MGREGICKDITQEINEYLELLEGDAESCQTGSVLDLSIELGEYLAAHKSLDCGDDGEFIRKIRGVSMVAANCPGKEG